MTEATALLLVYVAAALVYGATRERGRARLALLEAARPSRAARWAALAAAGFAASLWQGVESGPAAFLVIPVAFLALSTVIALLTPVLPRLVWMAAALSLVAIPILALVGGGS